MEIHRVSLVFNGLDADRQCRSWEPEDEVLRPGWMSRRAVESAHFPNGLPLFIGSEYRVARVVTRAKFTREGNPEPRSATPA